MKKTNKKTNGNGNGKKKYKKKRYFHRGKRCSKGEKLIATILDRYSIDYTMEKAFSTCKSPKNFPLRFDFFLQEKEVIIEFQGHHHYQPISKSGWHKLKHEKTLVHDQIKRRYATENGILFIEIPYWEYENAEDILCELLNLC